MTRANLSEVALLRRLLLPALKRLRFDFRMRHPWVPGADVFLNSFVHKGYWFHGKGRERQSMELVAELVSPGSTVVEVGGHIGFLSLYFACLAGPVGKVIVLEPGSNNLPYLRRNLADASRWSNLAPIELVEKAAGREAGELIFFEDDLSGQNNSLVEDYEGLRENSREAYVRHSVKARPVEVVPLDALVGTRKVNFVKIDVEGFELGVLEGMVTLLSRQRPVLMVEVQADKEAIFELLTGKGYHLFNIRRERVTAPNEMFENVFALNRTDHASLIASVMEGGSC